GTVTVDRERDYFRDVSRSQARFELERTPGRTRERNEPREAAVAGDGHGPAVDLEPRLPRAHGAPERNGVGGRDWLDRRITDLQNQRTIDGRNLGIPGAAA